MARRKLKHFADMDSMPHVFQYPKDMQGKWNTFFGNDNPIVLEIGCGRGAYTIGLAQLYPNLNTIGVDIKGARMWHGATYSLAHQLKNVAFLRTRIEQLSDYFSQGEVSEIWITFPDPQPRESREKKRLTSPRFLHIYKKILKTTGIVHLKTDDEGLFDFSLKTLVELEQVPYVSSKNLYNDLVISDYLKLKTPYEMRFLAENKPICYMRFGLQDLATSNQSNQS